MNPSEELKSRPALKRKLHDLLDAASPAVGKLFEPEAQSIYALRNGSGFVNVFMEIVRHGQTADLFNRALLHDTSYLDGQSKLALNSALKELINKEELMGRAITLFGDRFPPQIWDCCKRLCFTSIAVKDPTSAVMEELLCIHKLAEEFHKRMENSTAFIEKRRKGVGTSRVDFVSAGREERHQIAGINISTNRRDQLREFAVFVQDVLPFLHGCVDTPRGNFRPVTRLCTEAICRLLCISRNFLYLRKVVVNPEDATEEEIVSIIDSAGLRRRQHRRMGARVSCPSVESLPTFDCGCELPCLSGLSIVALSMESERFSKLSRQLKPRQKENQYLLNVLYDPLTNTTSRVCNKALAAWYNVSETLIADVRRSLNGMIARAESSGEMDCSIIEDGTKRYQYSQKHPINRVSDSIRERVENHLDVLLRADPSGSAGTSVCRVYSPEVNTFEKLQATLRESLSLEEDQNWELSSSTIQRMVEAYMKQRNYGKICFQQSDHNACPNCKSLQYSILQFSHERKAAKLELGNLLSRSVVSRSDAELAHLELLRARVRKRTLQEDECIAELKVHNERDKRIRTLVKELTDHFRDVENSYREAPKALRNCAPFGWRSFLDRASLTHQDDMTKVDLPHFYVSASSDITRWRFDVNAHVNAVTNDALVFSHEQGMGSKNSSLLVEEILLEHLMRCRGESIKIVISDNASVGKNWVTTVALPQYMVDQGLAEVVMILFLENNHGKFLADSLFGQFQTRRRKQTILGIDDMLLGFEVIKKSSGKVEGFALNPLSGIDFGKVFYSLGYETSPPKEVAFVKRNIHFATACAVGAKSKLLSNAKTKELAEKLCPFLPDEPGMVRLSTEPHSGRQQNELPFEDRYFDVPAVRLGLVRKAKVRHCIDTNAASGSGSLYVLGNLDGTLPDKESAPLTVPMDKKFAESGHGLVAWRTLDKVGYNGIKFRGSKACPELMQDSSDLVRRAWPASMIGRYTGEELLDDTFTSREGRKCAPVNWIARRPVSHFTTDEGDWKARYPPQNMLNAGKRKGPRESEPWLHTATYYEPPFPIVEKTSACSAMKRLAASHSDVSRPLNMLDALRAVFMEMGDREGVSDPWLQRRVSLPSPEAIARYDREIRLYCRREADFPKGVQTLRQAFREDEKVKEEAAKRLHEMRQSGNPTKKMKDAVFQKLFAEAELRPGGLARFKYLVEKDHERFAVALKEHRERQKQFDKDNGLEATVDQRQGMVPLDSSEHS